MKKFLTWLLTIFAALLTMIVGSLILSVVGLDGSAFKMVVAGLAIGVGRVVYGHMGRFINQPSKK